MMDLVGLFICSCVCGCLHALDMQVPVSSGAFEFSYVLALFYSGSRVGQSSCALLGCGFCTWTAKVAFCEFVLLAACFAFVAKVSGLEGPSGGNSFQPFDAMLAALLFSGMESVGHFTLFSGIELVGHFAQFPGICFEGRFKQFGWKRPVGQFRKGMLKDEDSVALSVSLVSSKVSFQVSPSGTLAGNFVAPVLRLLWTERHKPFINFNDDRSVVVVETVLAAKAVAAFQGTSSSVHSGPWEAQHKVQPVQFFVKGKAGSSTSVVRGCLEEVLSQVVGTDGLDVYATMNGKTLDLRSTLLSCGITDGCTVHIHFRLRGGSREDVPGQWTCSQCYAPRCWPVRKRCYRCGAARDDLPVSAKGKVNGKVDVAVGPLGRKPPQTAGNVPPTTRRPQVVPPRGPPGAGVGNPPTPKSPPSPPSEELVKAFQLLQSVLTPEDFSKYEKKLVPPKQQERVKLRERELLEAVERQANYEKQEQKHLEMIAKHEHNLAQQKSDARICSFLIGRSAGYGWRADGFGVGYKGAADHFYCAAPPATTGTPSSLGTWRCPAYSWQSAGFLAY